MRITIAFGMLWLAAGAGTAQDLSDVARIQDYRTQRASSSNEDLERNGDARSIPPGETLVLGELEGPGMITHMWCTVASPDIFYARSLVLRIYWDGADEPSVVAPLGDFFGVGHGAFADYTSAVTAVSSRGRARNVFWPMPFKESAKVTVTNDSPDIKTDSFYYYLDWRKYEELPADSAYFHAQYRQEFPAKPGNFTLLDAHGKGHYVGTVLSNQQMETGWFGEGDDFFYIDGEERPSLRGTGTEDYFSDAWGFRAFDTPYHGVSLWEGYFPGDRVTAYRWHIDSPVTFEESLHVEIEHKGSLFKDDTTFLGQFHERSDWVSAVAYWYQDVPVAVMDKLPPAKDRIAPYRILPAQDLAIEAEPKAMLMKQDDGVNYVPNKPDATIAFTFNVEQAGRYQINAVMTYGIFGGVYQPSLDGKPLGGPIDFCITGQDPIWTRFDLHDLEAGNHTLTFAGQGPSPNKRSLAPDFNGLGMYALVLLRMEDMEGYRAATIAAEAKR